jgi:hypothetical protein
MVRLAGMAGLLLAAPALAQPAFRTPEDEVAYFARMEVMRENCSEFVTIDGPAVGIRISVMLVIREYVLGSPDKAYEEWALLTEPILAELAGLGAQAWCPEQRAYFVGYGEAQIFGLD